MITNEELDEILRQALNTAAESVEPAGDGLQQIRRQLDTPRYQRQLKLWLTESTDMFWLLWIRLEPAMERARAAVLAAWTATAAWLRDKRGAVGHAAAPIGRPRQRAAHRSQPASRLAALLSPAMAWLRPALAVAAAVVIVVAGVFGLAQLRQTVTDISLLTGGSTAPSHHPSTAPASGVGSQTPRVVVPPLLPSPTPGSTHRATRHHATPAPSCTPRASNSPTAGSPSPTATATATPTDSGSPTPSPSDSASANPAVSGSASPAAGSGSNSTASGCTTK